MKVVAVTAHVVKNATRYELAGQAKASGTLPGSEYLRFGNYPHLYSQRSEAVVVEIETDEGIVGFGECQAPVGPEVVAVIIQRMLGPILLGRDPLDVVPLFQELYGSGRARGQVTGYQIDAIAGLDTALWDIRARSAGLSLSAALGGRFRDRLPSYVTGLRAPDRAGRLDEARGWASMGIGVKACLGHDPREDSREAEAIRSAVGDDATLFVDGVWGYRYHEAVCVGRALEDTGFQFFEAPLVAEDIRGHARLAAELDIAIAIGEPLRTRFQFLPWLTAEAMDVVQPDVMRNGPTETTRIASLAEAFNLPVALHTGNLTVIGMATTWHVAASLPTFLVQEYQPVMLETYNPWLAEPLRLDGGELVVPDGPGLGIDLDRDRFLHDVESSERIEL